MARTADHYKQLLKSLLPPGEAFPRDVGTSMDDLLAALAEEWARIDARGEALIVEALPSSTGEMLSDWERVAGLPDKCSGTLESTVQGRRNALIAKLTSTGGQSKAYFIAIAAALGYVVTIDEFHPFRAGWSQAGDPLTNGDWVFAWRVNGPEVTVISFKAGQSRAGEPLRVWGNDTLECKIRQLAPAHTIPIFAYANSSLDLLFALGVYMVQQQSVSLASVASITRSSVGTYFDSAGLLQAAAIDAPRFDYDPISHTPKGLLIEEARTNVLTFSSDFSNVAWSKTASSISASSMTAPDGSTMQKMTEGTGTSQHRVGRNTLTLGIPWTASIFAKAGERTKLAIGGTNTAANGGGFAVFDLTAGTVVSNTIIGAVATIKHMGSGIYRCSTQFPSTAVASQTLTINVVSPTNAVTYAGDGVSGLYIWGSQQESAADYSSYIPTAGAAATRSADNATLPVLTPWFKAVSGTFVIEHDAIAGSVLASSGASVLVTSQGPGKIAVSYDSAGSYVSYNGSAPVSGPVMAFDATMMILGIASARANAHCKSFRYYPRRVSDADLINLTLP